MLIKRKKPLKMARAIKDVIKILMDEQTEYSIARRYAIDDLHRIARSKNNITQCLAGSTAYGVFKIKGELKILKGFYSEAEARAMGVEDVSKRPLPSTGDAGHTPMQGEGVGKRLRCRRRKRKR